MRRKIIIVVGLCLMVAFAPWWLSVGVVLVALWQLGSGYELLLPALMADLAYGSPSPSLYGFAFPATYLTALAVSFGQVLTRRFFLQP